MRTWGELRRFRSSGTLVLVSVGVLLGTVPGGYAAWRTADHAHTQGPVAVLGSTLERTSVAGGVARGATGLAMRRLEAASVRLIGRGCDGGLAGAGIRVGPSSVLTAAHVVAGEADVTVDTAGELVGSVRIDRIVGIDAAIVTTAGTGPSVRVGRVRPRTGAKVVLAGAPEGGPLRFRSATVRGTIHGRGHDDPPLVLVLDVAVVPGDSGGAVLDDDGRLVGIVYARSGADGAALVVPVDAAVLARARTPKTGC